MPIDREHQDHRRKTILELLAERPMRRQMEIGDALRKAGFKATQSTVSRDLEVLGVVRQEGVYRLPEPRGDESALGQVESFLRDARSAGPHMLVLDTTEGAAKAVAAALRSAAWPEVRGILAEDDTLFIATDNVYDSRLLLQRLKRIVEA